MRVIIDTREQQPFTFAGHPDIATQPGALMCGDYSLAGFEERCAIERKSLQDLAQCLGRERERFRHELLRARGYDCFVVVVEASLLDLAQGRYRGALNPKAACHSVAAFTARLGIHFHFCGTRAAAESMTVALLRQYMNGAAHSIKALELACSQNEPSNAKHEHKATKLDKPQSARARAI